MLERAKAQMNSINPTPITDNNKRFSIYPTTSLVDWGANNGSKSSDWSKYSECIKILKSKCLIFIHDQHNTSVINHIEWLSKWYKQDFISKTIPVKYCVQQIQTYYWCNIPCILKNDLPIIRMKPFTHHTVQELQLLKFLADEKWGDVLSTVSAYNKYNTSILRKSLNHTTNYQKSVEDDSFQSIILYFINVAIRLTFYHFFMTK